MIHNYIKDKINIADAIKRELDQSTIIKLVASGAKVNDRDSEGVPALINTVKKRNLSIFRILLANNADVNICDQKGETPLSYCAKSTGMSEFVKLLIVHGANVNGSNSALVVAPLLTAISMRDEHTCRVLLDNGADLNVKCPGLDKSPIHLAATYNIMVDLLIEKGANLNARSADGRIALHEAALSQYCGESTLITLSNEMLRHGLDINRRDSIGNTALHYASSGQKAMILIQLGADINIENNLGQIPLSAIKPPEIHVFMKYVTLLQSAGLYVSKKNANLCKDAPDSTASFAQLIYEPEIARMKAQKVIATISDSWFDVLISNDLTHLRYSVTALEKNVIENYPNYGQLIKVKLYMGIARSRLLSEGKKHLSKYLAKSFDVWKVLLTDGIVMKILHTFSNEELRILIGTDQSGWHIRLCNDMYHEPPSDVIYRWHEELD